MDLMWWNLFLSKQNRVSQGVALSTQRTFSMESSSSKNKRAPLSASEGSVCDGAHPSERAYDSVSVLCLAEIRHPHMVNGWPNPLEKTPRLNLVLKGTIEGSSLYELALTFP